MGFNYLSYVVKFYFWLDLYFWCFLNFNVRQKQRDVAIAFWACWILPIGGVPWRLRHPPFRHCDTLTRTIRHCNDSPHKGFHIEIIRPHRCRTVRPHPNRSVRPLRSGSKRLLWQSDPRSIRPILCFTRRVRGQFGRRHTDGAVKKQRCPTWKNFTHAWVSRAQAWHNLTPNMARPTQQNSI